MTAKFLFIVNVQVLNLHPERQLHFFCDIISEEINVNAAVVAISSRFSPRNYHNSAHYKNKSRIVFFNSGLLKQQKTRKVIRMIIKTGFSSPKKSKTSATIVSQPPDTLCHNAKIREHPELFMKTMQKEVDLMFHLIFLLFYSFIS